MCAGTSGWRLGVLRVGGDESGDALQPSPAGNDCKQSKSRFRKSRSTRDPPHEEHDGSRIEEGACGVDGSFEVFCQSPIAADAGEEPLDNPASWLNGEADLIGVLAHNLDSDQRGVCDLLTGITAISENALDEWEDAARDAQERSAAIAILDACWVRLEYEATPIRIDECMALTSVDL